MLILEWQGADPKVAWDYVYEGTLQTAEKRADLVAFWMPLAITSFGLVLTYNAGLWNIGVEGQMIMGAIGATWAVRLFAENSPLGLHLGRTADSDHVFYPGSGLRALVGGGWSPSLEDARRRQRDFWRRGAQLHRADVQHVPGLERRSLAAHRQPRHRNRPLSRRSLACPRLSNYRRLSPTTIYRGDRARL